MPNSEVDVVAISVVGREFKIKCPKDKISELKEAADYLNDKMREVQHSDKPASIDRVAITAALNISHELMLEKQSSEENSNSLDKLGKKLFDLKDKVELALEIA